MIRRFFFFLASILFLLIIVLAGNTLLHGSQQITVAPATAVAIDEQVAARRLADSLRFVTISSQTDVNANTAEFKKLHAFIDQSYPHIRATLQRETIGANSLLYKWEGTDATAKPILLMAHQDIVPIAPGTEQQWQQPPFAGKVQDGFIWGRGAWDDKGNLFPYLKQ